eukprot:2147842-Pleurochrysis_carterae.AAC.3
MPQLCLSHRVSAGCCFRGSGTAVLLGGLQAGITRLIPFARDASNVKVGEVRGAFADFAGASSIRWWTCSTSRERSSFSVRPHASAAAPAESHAHADDGHARSPRLLAF